MVYRYTVNGQTVQLEEDSDLVAIRYTEPALHSFRAAFSTRVGADFRERIEVPNEKFTLLRTPDAAAEPVVKALSTVLNTSNEGVMRTTPVFKIGDTRVLATDRVLLGVEDLNISMTKILSGINYASVKPRGNGEFTVTLAPDADPLKIANEIAARDGVVYAEPDFVNILRPTSSVASPEQVDSEPISFRDEQYAIRLTEADKAWTLVTGNPKVVVAILDDGVDTRHPDLRRSVIGGFDAIDNDSYQEPNSWDGHGTACAGLAAALPSNESGVRGIGAGCSILAVRIAHSPEPGADWFSPNGGFAAAIDWAWENGADVLSNSWGGSPSSAVTLALNRARKLGRNGLGCVIVAAAGNSGGNVLFPANLPGLLCVAASDQDDEPKTHASADGEQWSSCHGPEVSVAAPGVRNFTTDIAGKGGYEPGDYIATFNGTSSATPIVAGACALMLSANPGLRGERVQSLLTSSADKVGSVPYEDGRNDRLGYGRVNVLRAVQAAQLV